MNKSKRMVGISVGERQQLRSVILMAECVGSFAITENAGAPLAMAASRKIRR